MSGGDRIQPTGGQIRSPRGSWRACAYACTCAESGTRARRGRSSGRCCGETRASGRCRLAVQCVDDAIVFGRAAQACGGAADKRQCASGGCGRLGHAVRIAHATSFQAGGERNRDAGHLTDSIRVVHATSFKAAGERIRDAGRSARTISFIYTGSEASRGRASTGDWRRHEAAHATQPANGAGAGES